MNTTKVDTTNITAAEFLRMRDRCCQLEQKNAELTETINRMHGGCERAIELRRLLDAKHLASELGDVLWYIAYTADDLGYPLSVIMAMNQEKLAKRYPDGKFDSERSKNREEGDI